MLYIARLQILQKLLHEVLQSLCQWRELRSQLHRTAIIPTSWCLPHAVYSQHRHVPVVKHRQYIMQTATGLKVKCQRSVFARRWCPNLGNPCFELKKMTKMIKTCPNLGNPFCIFLPWAKEIQTVARSHGWSGLGGQNLVEAVKHQVPM